MFQKTAARVTGLYIYPVKSCRGISLDHLEITPTGPKYDRQWMLVDENNQFITLRTHSELSQIKTHITEHYLQLYLGSNKILIDLTTECETTETVTVWNDQVVAGVENKSINEAISDFLQKSVKLVRYQSQSHRDLKHKNAATDAVSEVRFADSRPALLVNQNSLIELNKVLAQKNANLAVIERFRANIIVDGLEAFSEDQIKKIKIGDIVFENPKLCGRCPVITKDVETGKVVSKETLGELAQFRREVNGIKVPFGVNLTPANLGTICLNDIIEVLV